MEKVWIFVAIHAVLNTEYAVQNRLSTYYLSLPVPVNEGGTMFITVAHVSESAPVEDKEQILYTDMIVSKVRYPDIAIYSYKSSPADYNIPYVGNEIGSIDRSHITSVADYVEAKKEYQALLSKVLEKGWLAGKNQNLQEQSETAKQLLDCWEILKEDKLMPFYQKVGGQFFEWMNRYGK